MDEPKRKGLFQFSLRTLVIAVVVIAIPLFVAVKLHVNRSENELHGSTRSLVHAALSDAWFALSKEVDCLLRDTSPGPDRYYGNAFRYRLVRILGGPDAPHRQEKVFVDLDLAISYESDPPTLKVKPLGGSHDVRFAELLRGFAEGQPTNVKPLGESQDPHFTETLRALSGLRFLKVVVMENGTGESNGSATVPTTPDKPSLPEQADPTNKYGEFEAEEFEIIRD